MKYYQHRAGLTEWEVEQQDFEEFARVHGSGWSPLSKAIAWAAWAERSGVRRAYRDTQHGTITANITQGYKGGRGVGRLLILPDGTYRVVGGGGGRLR